MSKHRDIVPLGDMLDYGRRVVAKVTNLSRIDFDADDNLQLATTHLLQIIGEAAERVSEAVRQAHPEIEWPKIVGDAKSGSFTITGASISMSFGRRRPLDVPRLVLALEAFMPSDPP